MTEKKNNFWTRYHRNNILIFGLILTGFGIYQFSTLLTFKSQLAEIKGGLNSADTYVITVKDRRSKTKSQKSELIFYISGWKQKFRIVENIGDDYRNEEFEEILKELKRADSVTVWVRKTELDKYEPKIFQIETERKTILAFEKVRTKNRELTLFILFAGIGLLIYYFWTVNSEKFQKLLKDS